MRATDPSACIRELRGLDPVVDSQSAPSKAKVRVKICGITKSGDALHGILTIFFPTKTKRQSAGLTWSVLYLPLVPNARWTGVLHLKLSRH